jgi:hypothetical protein
MALSPSDVVVLVDGFHHQAGLVRSKEILDLLAIGVRVVGCSGLGALRAAELHRYGMIGNGEVFELYRQGVIDGDEEVAVADDPPFTVPIVNVLHGAAAAVVDQIVTEAAATAIVGCVRSLPRRDRTWQAMRDRAGRAAVAEAFAAFEGFLAAHPEHADVKAADALDTLRHLDADPAFGTAALDQVPT